MIVSSTPPKIKVKAELREMTEEQKRQLLSNHSRYGTGRYERHPSIMQKIVTSGVARLVATILGIALIYGVVNLFLVGGQELWHMGDNKKLEEMKIMMDNELKIIQDYEALNKNGRITDKQYNTYKETLDLYNKQVNEYNNLAKSAGTTWYVIPGLGKGHH